MISKVVQTRGASLLETVVALTLGALMLHLALTSFQRIRSAHGRVTSRIEILESFRIGRFVPRRELRHALPLDWGLDADSLTLRAFRGTALVCQPDGISTDALVSFGGDRRPDPAKDSVVLVGADGERIVAGLSGLGTAVECPGSALPTELWRLDRPVPEGTILARLFERGSYHLNGSALRYRRGRSGRQPLTAEVWSTPETAWLQSADATGFRYVAAGSGREWVGFLAWRDRQ